MMKAMPTLPELPSALAKSPHFQVERVRRHTKDEVERTLAKHSSTMREYWILTCVDGEPMSQYGRQFGERGHAPHHNFMRAANSGVYLLLVGQALIHPGGGAAGDVDDVVPATGLF